jgi:hypothetical protein
MIHQRRAGHNGAVARLAVVQQLYNAAASADAEVLDWARAAGLRLAFNLDDHSTSWAVPSRGRFPVGIRTRTGE